MSHGKKIASSTNGFGKTGQPHAEEGNDHFLAPYTKIDSKWMKNLNVRKESIKILEENTGSKLFDLSRSNVFLGTSPKARKQGQK